MDFLDKYKLRLKRSLKLMELKKDHIQRKILKDFWSLSRIISLKMDNI